MKHKSSGNWLILVMLLVSGAVIALAAGRASAAPGDISTVAGNGTAGFAGDGGPATAARFNFPRGVAVDGAGNRYIVDLSNNRIRKVDAAGVITTVAGNGTASFAGDGGSATSASLNNPRGVSVDGSGNLYIGDTSNHRIRKVAASGIITTVAGTGVAGFSGDGGPATSARLTFPDGVVVDGSGNLYIAEVVGHRVRKVDASGIITTVAGNGLATFAGDGGPATAASVGAPSGVSVDGSGNLYIADQGNHRIRKVDAAGVITTVAGNGTPGFAGDGGPATVARLQFPSGVSVDGSGNLYIADANNSRIRKVEAVPSPAYAQSAASLSFGDLSVGASGAQTFTVANTGTGPLTVSGISVTGADAGQFSASPTMFTINPGDLAQTVTATFSPTSAGAKSASLSVSHNAAGSPATVSLSGTGQIAVNQPPVAVADAATTDEDTPVAIEVRANDSDPEHDPLTVTAVTPGTSGAVAIELDGTLTYTPSPDFNGSDTFTYTISDGNGGTATAEVAVTVNPVNDAPSFTKGADQIVDEDAGPQMVAGWATDIAAGPADEAGQTLTFEVTNDHHALFSAPPAMAADGTLTYTPAPDANGSATVTVQLRDNGGTANGGVDTEAQTFGITVTPVNDPPVLAEVAPQSVDEGQLLSFAVSASDPDSPVTLSIEGAPAGASLTDHQDGTATFTWTPGYDQAGTYAVTFTASDGNLSDSKSMAITVTNVTRTITATAGANGTITPDGETTVDHGSSQSYTIAASAGYRIEDVLVDGVSVGAVNTYTFSNVTANHTLSASFAVNTFTLTATAGPGGTIAPAGVTTVTYGTNQGYTIAAGAGYGIADVLVDGASVGAVNTYSFSDVTANHTIAASFADITPPVLTLNGANPLLLELGSAYPEPGATASDLADGDLSDQIQISGVVNADAEGSYTLTYTVRDAAGNSASATRTVQVLVTANSYGLIATHSLHLRQNAQVHSGFAGVVNQGTAPFLAGKVELVVGTRVQTAAGVRLSAPRVRVRQHADIDGQLVYNQLVAVGKHATIAQQTQVPSSYFPLFQGSGLPTFQTGTPGSQDVEVRQKGSATLAAGSYDEVRIKQKGTLTFAGGTYQLGDLEVGQQARVIFLAPTTLLIRGQLSLDQKASFGPGAGLDASDILVYVEGRNGRLGSSHDDDEGDDEEDDSDGRRLRQSPRSVKIGEQASFQGNLYAPNGTIHLRQGSTAVGSFIARDLIVGVRAQVAAQSGWNTPGVIYQPQTPVAKLAGEQGATAALPTETGLLPNYPNPFNPSTTVPYMLSETGLVKLSVYNVLGQQVRVLVDQLQVPGAYTVSWDGMDAAGLQAAGGVYFYRLQAGEHIQVRKMLFAK